MMGFALPDVHTVKGAEEALTDKFWIAILCVPEVIIAIVLPLWLFFFKTESLKFSIDRGN